MRVCGGNRYDCGHVINHADTLERVNIVAGVLEIVNNIVDGIGLGQQGDELHFASIAQGVEFFFCSLFGDGHDVFLLSCGVVCLHLGY